MNSLKMLIPSVVASVALGVVIGSNFVATPITAQDVEEGAEKKADEPKLETTRGLAVVNGEGDVRAKLSLDDDGNVQLLAVDDKGNELSLLDDLFEEARKRVLVNNMLDHVKEINEREDIDDNKIKVQHILIGVFDPANRATQRFSNSAEEAEAKAAELFARIQEGEDFDTLVKEYSDDGHPGTYTLIEEGASDRQKLIFKRNEMVPAFGDVGYKLKVGEVSVAVVDSATSPYGYHIVKRLE